MKNRKVAEDLLVREVENKLRQEKCAFCGEPAEGDHSIHQNGFGEGPEVELCNKCGSQPEPTEVQIWAKIGQSDICIYCQGEILPGDERRGSFHAWCAP